MATTTTAAATTSATTTAQLFPTSQTNEFKAEWVRMSKKEFELKNK
jgi:hypothetical protein